jgi:hypothetical protein
MDSLEIRRMPDPGTNGRTAEALTRQDATGPEVLGIENPGK